MLSHEQPEAMPMAVLGHAQPGSRSMRASVAVSPRQAAMVVRELRLPGKPPKVDQILQCRFPWWRRAFAMTEGLAT